MKSVLYLGAMLLVGGIVTARLVAPAFMRVRGRRLLLLGLALGAVLLIGGALLEVAVTLKGVLGRLDLELYRRYLGGTRHGEMALLRVAVTAATALIALALSWPRAAAPNARPPRGGRAVGLVGDLTLLVLCAELLYTFSALSHAAAMGGPAPLWVDLAHLVAAALWAGPVLYLAVVGGFERARPEATAALRRLSAIGLVAVAVLFLTGAFNALTHAGDPAAFARSAYGWSLWVKLALFGLVIVLGARNRFALLPDLVEGGPARPMERSLRVEALVLLAIFVVTGALTTAVLPHSHGAGSDVLTNLLGVIEALGH